ncbi:DUF1697 domain-containing protein [Sporolactobacillus shoreae]|uniref:DUF1697 domain-containing protein n=1 Tax=Sporolactobacillus shoreae TaxID=1465501 RepID=A0A4Z0GPG2_9BACL|nr:DUF1697 domain-containing protein [Sporolactobacillus shoreae]TGA98296.1 DUF1697 domain-containing protein [Sporolactobacillus shoreae]
MTIYIALLRGINVGGKNKIKMADLRESLTEVGLTQVRTYIQSGNVLFQSSETEPRLNDLIGNKMEQDFGFPVSVILRTAEELRKIIISCPFSEDEIKAAEATSVGESLYVSLMSREPIPEKVEFFKARDQGGDKYKMVGRDLYLLYHHSIRNAKLSANIQKLAVPSTVRNWKTLNKLHQLAEE